MARSFSASLTGRVKNFRLAQSQPLLPLFEAIVNSMHAIDERRLDEPNLQGRITVRVLREDQRTFEGMDGEQAIRGFVVEDNGVGFNLENLESFMTSDSMHKQKLGGKGVGRFSWLVAFREVYVESDYYEGSERHKRTFIFSLKSEEIDDTVTEVDSEQNEISTRIELRDYVEGFKSSSSLPKTAETLARRILEHFLVYFLADDCPDVLLDDPQEDTVICLNDKFSTMIEIDENINDIEIEGHQFQLLNIKVLDQASGSNSVLLCANNRRVIEKELSKYVPDMTSDFHSRVGYWYQGILTGKYLDDHVDMTRLSFDIPDGNIGPNLLSPVTMPMIMERIAEQVTSFLGDDLQKISQDKINRIQGYMAETAPQYVPLMRHSMEAIRKLPPNLSDEKLDDELYRMNRDFSKSARSKAKKILSEFDPNSESLEEYRKQYSECVKEIGDVNRAALANYVAHRKVIIDLLEKGIRKSFDGKYEKERLIHELIYPMNSTSEDVPFESHSLWLLDERLAYSHYIASDVSMGAKAGEARPDLLILDSPVAVSTEVNDGSIFDSVTIFELKRPMRKDYTASDNPIEQLLNYVDRLRDGKVEDKNGRPVIVRESTKIFLYAVCDISAGLKKIAERRGFTLTPDEQSYYTFMENYNAYFEIVSYDKLIADAKLRNNAFFNELGL